MRHQGSPCAWALVCQLRKGTPKFKRPGYASSGQGLEAAWSGGSWFEERASIGETLEGEGDQGLGGGVGAGLKDRAAGLRKAGDRGGREHTSAGENMLLQPEDRETQARRPAGGLGWPHRWGQPWADSGPWEVGGAELQRALGLGHCRELRLRGVCTGGQKAGLGSLGAVDRRRGTEKWAEREEGDGRGWGRGGQGRRAEVKR